MRPDDAALAAHYHEQAFQLRAMAAILPGAELKADLRAAARLYEDFAGALETSERLYGGG